MGQASTIFTSQNRRLHSHSSPHDEKHNKHNDCTCNGYDNSHNYCYQDSNGHGWSSCWRVINTNWNPDESYACQQDDVYSGRFACTDQYQCCVP